MNSKTSPASQGFAAGIQLRTSQLLLSHGQQKEYIYHNQSIKNPQIKQNVQISSQNTARRALGLARAVRTTLEAQSYATAMQIAEMEEYLGLMRHESESIAELENLMEVLRQRKAVIDMRGAEADEQIGEVRQMLDNHGIPEGPLSEDKYDSYHPQSPPVRPSSYINSDTDSDLSDGDSGVSWQESTDSANGDHLSTRQKVLLELFQRSVGNGDHRD